MIMRLGLGLIVVATLLGVATVKPRGYRNEEFGIALPVPRGILLCPIREDRSDHGPHFLLGAAGVKSCSDFGKTRFIDIFASYNAVDATKKLHDFLTSICTDVGGGPCVQAPAGLSIKGLRSAAARVNRSDGWIDIIVVAQGGKPDPAFDPTIPSINYDLSLHTRPENLEEDLRVFRSVLQTVQLRPAQ